MNDSTKNNQNLSTGLLAYCQAHNVDAPLLSDKLGYGYQHAWRLLAGISPVTAETVGRFVLGFGTEATDELLDLAGITTDSLPHADDAQVVPVVLVPTAA
jgi:hypothetical protein